MFAAVPEVKYAKDSLQSNCKGFPSKHCQNLVTLLDCNKTNFFSKFKWRIKFIGHNNLSQALQTYFEH